MLRVAFALIDVTKDVLSAVGYFKKGFEGLSLAATLVTPVIAWELGITWFLAIYTTLGMFIPAVAYSAMFSVLLIDFNGKGGLEGIIYWVYYLFSVPLSPVIGVIRYFSAKIF